MYAYDTCKYYTILCNRQKRLWIWYPRGTSGTIPQGILRNNYIKSQRKQGYKSSGPWVSLWFLRSDTKRQSMKGKINAIPQN